MMLGWQDIAREHREELLREVERWGLAEALAANRREASSRSLEWFPVSLRDGRDALVETRYDLSGFCGRRRRENYGRPTDA